MLLLEKACTAVVRAVMAAASTSGAILVAFAGATAMFGLAICGGLYIGRIGAALNAGATAMFWGASCG